MKVFWQHDNFIYEVPSSLLDTFAWKIFVCLKLMAAMWAWSWLVALVGPALFTSFTNRGIGVAIYVVTSLIMVAGLYPMLQGLMEKREMWNGDHHVEKIYLSLLAVAGFCTGALLCLNYEQVGFYRTYPIFVVPAIFLGVPIILSRINYQLFKPTANKVIMVMLYPATTMPFVYLYALYCENLKKIAYAASHAITP